MSRKHLPNRRRNVAFNFDCEHQHYRATVGFYVDGRLAEIFIDAKKPGTALQANAENSAVLASMLLQHGVHVDKILHSLNGPIAVALEIARTL